MNHRLTLTITSLLSILLANFHVTDDIVRGFDGGGLGKISFILMLVTWLYGTLVLGKRRVGLAIVLIFSLLGCVISIAHMRGAGMVGGRVAGTSGMFFWVWTQITLGVTSLFSAILAAQGLWSLQRSHRLLRRPDSAKAAVEQ